MTENGRRAGRERRAPDSIKYGHKWPKSDLPSTHLETPTCLE
jgi:hypothetical protein